MPFQHQTITACRCFISEKTEELTGTKISSMIKAELSHTRSCWFATVVFSHFIWKMLVSGGVPFWAMVETQAYRKGLVYTSTMPGRRTDGCRRFIPAFLLFGLGLSLATMPLCLFGLPVLLSAA